MTLDLIDWTEEHDQLKDVFQKLGQTSLENRSASFGANLQVVTCFSTLFAEWAINDSDLIIHLFPRSGEKDEWREGTYLNRCRSCRAEVPRPVKGQGLKPCRRCGHVGLLYIPGRGEERDARSFPGNIFDLIKDAANKVWLGDVKHDFVPELGAWVLKFINAGSLKDVSEAGGLMDKFLEALDALLEGRLLCG